MAKNNVKLKTAMIAENNVTEIFVIADDFWKFLSPP